VLKSWKIAGAILSIIVIAAAYATVVKFTQTFPNGTVTIGGATGIMQVGSCTTLVDETPNPTVESGSIWYDCGQTPTSQSAGLYAFSVINNTVIATPTFSISYTNHCGVCSVGLSIVNVTPQVQYYSTSSNLLASGQSVTFTYHIQSGPGFSDFFDYRVDYGGFANGTAITLSAISWA
jgi:hypothetical protein